MSLQGAKIIVPPLIAACLALAATRVRAQEPEEGFEPLFNGVDLTGWVSNDGLGLVAGEGELVSSPKGPGVIMTERRFSDFILRLEYWVDPGTSHEANGGIFFRALEGGPPGEGYEAQISDFDSNNPSGSLFGMVPQNIELVNAIAPSKQWNTVQLRAVGPRIQVWFNGEQLQDATLHNFSSGSIGLQHHHNGCIIKYRNIRIKELGPEDAEPGWRPILNGSDLEGWTARGKTDWTVEDGVLVGRGGLGNLYYTAESFADFELRAMARISAKSNSGIVFRSRWPEGDAASFAVGYECQIDNWDARNTTGPKNVTGGIYGRAYAPLLTRDDAWFSLHIRAVGDHLQTWVNGRNVTDIHDASFTEGLIALPNFGRDAEVRFRDILVRKLD